MRFLFIALFRLFFWLILFWVVTVLARWFSQRKGGTAAKDAVRNKRGATDNNILVKDFVCGAYIPQSSAIRAVRGGETQYFCSLILMNHLLTIHHCFPIISPLR